MNQDNDTASLVPLSYDNLTVNFRDLPDRQSETRPLCYTSSRSIFEMTTPKTPPKRGLVDVFLKILSYVGRSQKDYLHT
jgi:hypothetical protein